MAETTADVRRDIELTRERMSSTLRELEHRLNLVEVVKDHPWPALAVAFGTGLVLAGTHADQRAAQATADASRTFSRSAGGRIGPAIDGLLADLLHGVRGAVEDRVEALVADVRQSILGSAAARGAQGAAARGAAPQGAAPQGVATGRAAAELGPERDTRGDGALAASEDGEMRGLPGGYHVSEVTGMRHDVGAVPRAD